MIDVEQILIAPSCAIKIIESFVCENANVDCEIVGILKVAH